MVNNLDELSGVGHRHPGLQGLVWHMNKTNQTKGQIYSHTCEIYGQHTINALELNNIYKYSRITVENSFFCMGAGVDIHQDRQ